MVIAAVSQVTNTCYARHWSTLFCGLNGGHCSFEGPSWKYIFCREGCGATVTAGGKPVSGGLTQAEMTELLANPSLRQLEEQGTNGTTATATSDMTANMLLGSTRPPLSLAASSASSVLQASVIMNHFNVSLLSSFLILPFPSAISIKTQQDRRNR